jgi:histidine ammonia-lyase
MSDPIVLDGDSLTLADVERFLAAEARGEVARVEIAPRARERVARGRSAIEKILERGDVVYGVNTGFGRLADVRISNDKVRELQRNLIRSHAAGVGEPFPADVVRLAMLLRANTIAKGYSGVRPETLDALVAAIDAGFAPCVPSLGSVGASGDLAPLAHMALALMGEGEALEDGRRVPASESLARRKLAPIDPQAKEGLALVNGTQVSCALAAKALVRARRLVRTADVLGALSLDALLGTNKAFHPRIHALRPHPGQKASAANLTRLLEGSGYLESHRDCGKVQDAYSLRCMPQVHGSAREGVEFASTLVERELNAATDNPLVFPEDGAVLAGGNFHGAPIALAADVLAIALTDLASISERRIERLVNPDLSELPPFLAGGDTGLNSGLMMAQVTAAALVSESKVLSHPASVDSIPTCGSREDHVSMATHASRKALSVVSHLEHVLAVEALAAAQGLDLRGALKSSPPLEAARGAIRRHVPTLERDRPLSPDLARLAAAIGAGEVVAAVESVAGALA